MRALKGVNMLHSRFERKLILIAAALVASSVVFAVALVPASSGEIRPLLQSLGIISCSGPNPCQEGSNSSTGPGLEGISVKGKGVVGQTKFNSTSSSNGQAGVFGNDLSTSGAFDSGVSGLSVRGNGVLGSSASGFGVVGRLGGASGVPISSNAGVLGDSVSAIGVIGTAVNHPGVVGISQKNNGITAATQNPSTVTGYAAAGVSGYDKSTDGGHLNLGVFGNSTNGIGVEGVSFSWVGVNAVGGFLDSSTGDRFPALSIVGNITSFKGNDLIDACEAETVNPCDDFHSAFGVDGVGNVGTIGNVTALGDILVGGAGFPDGGVGNVNITGKYFVSGVCKVGCIAATRASAGRAVTQYVPTQSVPSVEDFGEAQLVNGQTYVQLSPDFANVVEQRANYLVFITPEGDANTLYVTQKSPSGFAVRESHAGRSTLMFSYRIVAKPFSSHEARLPMVELPRLRRPGRPTHTRPLHL